MKFCGLAPKRWLSAHHILVRGGMDELVAVVAAVDMVTSIPTRTATWSSALQVAPLVLRTFKCLRWRLRRRTRRTRAAALPCKKSGMQISRYHLSLDSQRAGDASSPSLHFPATLSSPVKPCITGLSGYPAGEGGQHVPGGPGRAPCFARDGAAAEKTNELLENANTAIEKLFKRRGYDAKKPELKKEKLGYPLDRYEAAAYLVTGAMHFPLLSPPEAWSIGKRITNIIGTSGTVGAKLKALRKRDKAAAPQIAALLQAPSTLNLELPPRKGTAPSAPPLALPPVPPVPPPPTGTHLSSAELYHKVFGSIVARLRNADAMVLPWLRQG